MLQSVCTAWPDGNSHTVESLMMCDILMFEEKRCSDSHMFGYSFLFCNTSSTRSSVLHSASLSPWDKWRPHITVAFSTDKCTKWKRNDPQRLKRDYVTLSCHWHSHKLIFMAVCCSTLCSLNNNSAWTYLWLMCCHTVHVIESNPCLLLWYHFLKQMHSDIQVCNEDWLS